MCKKGDCTNGGNFTDLIRESRAKQNKTNLILFFDCNLVTHNSSAAKIYFLVVRLHTLTLFHPLLTASIENMLTFILHGSHISDLALL